MSEEMQAFSVKHTDLSEAVEKAVADVLHKHNLTAGKQLTLGPGTLMGRILRELDANMNLASLQKASADIAGQVSAQLGVAKGAFTPATVIAGGVITMGFIAREQVQIL